MNRLLKIISIIIASFLFIVAIGLALDTWFNYVNQSQVETLEELEQRY